MNFDILSDMDARELGEDLIRARKRAGMTQEEAAKIIEAARTTLTAIEKGDRQIRPGELIKLSRAYGRQVSDFVRPRPKVEPFAERVQFRGPYSRTLDDDNKVEPSIEQFEDLCRDYLELEKITNSHYRYNYRSEYPIPKTHLAHAAESLAIEERNRLSLGDGPVPMIRDILEETGLRIFYLKMPAKFSEVYVYDDYIGGCMAINSDHPEERRRWSMVHGYAHFLTNRYKAVLDTDKPHRFRSESDSEKFADYFAMFFLMPTYGLRRRVTDIREKNQKLPISDLFRLADRFGVGLQAMVLRLEEMRELATGSWDQLQVKVSIKQAKLRLGLGDIPGRTDVLPVRYKQLAFEAHDKKLISETQLANFLRVKRVDARLLSGHYQSTESESAPDSALAGS